jgi:Kef-type K+ transport system membrane component KefB
MELPLISSLLFVIVVSRLLGQFFARFKQPEILGEMLAGVILGPAVLGLVRLSPALSGVAEVAVFLIILQAGLEMNAGDVINSLKGKGFLLSVLGFIIPFITGIGVAQLFEMDLMRTIFLGLCISITALPVAIRILESFKILDSEIAKLSISVAIINDICAMLILGVILSLPDTHDTKALFMGILVTGGKFIVLAATILLFYSILRKIEARGIKVYKFPEKIVSVLGSEALFGFLIIFVLCFSSVSELLGFHAVIGAFFGALLIDRKFFLSHRYKEINTSINSISNGFLAPVFFACLGLQFNLQSMTSWYFVACVLLASIFSKFLAGYVGGRLSKMSMNDSMGLGIILNGRGVMELVVANIAYQKGFIGQGLFSTLVLMGLVTTVITPILFKYVNKPANVKA